MRCTCLPGTLVPMLVLMVCLPGNAEEKALEEAADSGTSTQSLYKSETPSGRTPTPHSATERKDKRHPGFRLEVPEDVEETTTEGISLDDALQRLLVANRDLAIKYHEIPKARADILSAGIIENPAIFLDAEGIPYGNYSPQRPGDASYGPTVVFPPLDLSGKRRKRIQVARRAEKVLEAVYQDAVRLETDKLYSAYVDVLEAEIRRSALQRAQTQLEQMQRLLPAREGQQAGRSLDNSAVQVQEANTRVALRTAEANLLQARRELGRLLALTGEQADELRVRGSIRDRAAPPPATDELISLALQSRPDLAALQLSVARAQANVQLSRAERWDDVLTFYTPYQAVTFPSQGLHTATGWEVGGLTVVPIFERNQGDIVRAKANVTQLQIQSQGMKDQIVYEVQHAATEYAVSRLTVQKYESIIVPRAHKLRDEKLRRVREGQESLDAVLSAEQSYDTVSQRYLEALVNHRHAMLRLNTVVGQRILP